jgi:hypothetical protein
LLLTALGMLKASAGFQVQVNVQHVVFVMAVIVRVRNGPGRILACELDRCVTVISIDQLCSRRPG